VIFYTANDGQRIHVLTTQAEAAIVSKDYEKVDVPTDKSGLQATLQEFYDLLQAANNNQNGSNNPVEMSSGISLPDKNQFEDVTVKQRIFLWLSDVWDALPLVYQCHLIARTCANMQQHIGKEGLPKSN